MSDPITRQALLGGIAGLGLSGLAAADDSSPGAAAADDPPPKSVIEAPPLR